MLFGLFKTVTSKKQWQNNMTDEELRDYLIEKKAINDFEDEDPFVGTWLSTMVELKIR